MTERIRMQETPPKPHGSTIEVIEDFDDRIYRWKPPTGGVFRIFAATILFLWLGGWLGSSLAIFHSLQGKEDKISRDMGVAMLCGWIAGGIVLSSMVYLVIRPTHPESVRLSTD